MSMNMLLAKTFLLIFCGVFLFVGVVSLARSLRGLVTGSSDRRYRQRHRRSGGDGVASLHDRLFYGCSMIGILGCLGLGVTACIDIVVSYRIPYISSSFGILSCITGLLGFGALSLFRGRVINEDVGEEGGNLLFFATLNRGMGLGFIAVAGFLLYLIATHFDHFLQMFIANTEALIQFIKTGSQVT